MPTLAECDAKLARYRAALDAGADPAVVAGWIAETQTRRKLAEQRQHTPVPPPRDTESELTTEQITAIIDELGDMITALRDADPEDKLDIYRNLGLRLTYDPQTQTVRAEIDLATHRWDSGCVRGGTRPRNPSTSADTPCRRLVASMAAVARGLAGHRRQRGGPLL